VKIDFNEELKISSLIPIYILKTALNSFRKWGFEVIDKIVASDRFFALSYSDSFKSFRVVNTLSLNLVFMYAQTCSQGLSSGE
jgi:hypothetical protein